MPGFIPFQASSRSETGLWALLNVVVLGCIAATFLSYLKVGTHEIKQANENGQRAVIDAETGKVSVGNPHKTSEFDVAKTIASPPSQPDKAVEENISDASDDVDLSGLPTLRTEPLSTALPEAKEGRGLIPAPAPEVTDKSHGAPMPKRNGDISPFTLYSQRFKRTPEQKLLSFVVLDAGLSAQSLPLLLSMPKEVTLAFSPYAGNAQERIAKAREQGFETWAMLPSMTARYPQDDPGPLGLVATLPKDELMRRLQEVMTETIGSVGFVLPPDETLSTKAAAFSPILADIDARGLAVLTTHPTHSSKQVAGKSKSLVGRSDLLLDPAPDAEAIERKLADIEPTLKTSDSMIIVLSARPQTLLIVQKWLKEHKLEEPITLAPLSAQWLPKEAAPEPEAPAESSGHGAPKEEKKKEPEKKPANSEKKKESGGHH